MLSAITLGLRGLQAILSIVVLALAANLIKAQYYGGAPVTTKYSSFTGGFGIIVCAIGVAGLFLSMIPEIVVLALDGLLGVFFLGGGIAYAIGLKGVSCSEISDSNYKALIKNPLLNEGEMPDSEGQPFYGIYWRFVHRDEDQVRDLLFNKCKQALSDEIIQFVLFGLAFGFLALGYLRMRKGSGGPTSSAV